jgi:secreted PhoX family phosphatase
VVRADRTLDDAKVTRELVEIEMAAHGNSIIEIRRGTAGKWAVAAGSSYARRITALDTPMRVSGPAAGHPRLRTRRDPTGTRVIGTLNNCAGGITPWGTYLSAEENFHGYFSGKAEGTLEERNHRRYGVPGSAYQWARHHDRFDVRVEPNEPNRFGWIVEIDPYDPSSTPIKRTALGRTKHEGAESIVNVDGRVVVYSGDDERFEYVYKFVSDGRVEPGNRAANLRLLDSGTLFVARFDEDGTATWLPLVWGTGPLTPEQGFVSQADVLIEARRAADLLGATPMDRPEDVEPDPVSGRVYVILTNNEGRRAGDANARRRPNRANPRPENHWGHIIEMVPPGGDHAALKFGWDVLVRGGDPRQQSVGALFNPATSTSGWFACPDNCAVDGRGRLWIATDQGTAWKKASGTADGLWALETQGERRGTGRMFFRVPVGAEMCGPVLTPDDTTLFLAVQHPATDGVKDWATFGRASTFEDPATRWPDFDPGMPPRPSIVAVTRRGGGRIG